MAERKNTILIVDDSEMNRSILTDILGEEFNILEACNGIEAVNLIRSSSTEISLILLDIVMPKMDGLGVLAMMNSYKWIQDIPVIMISAEDASAYIGKAYELGATDYIQRPFDSTVVNRRVMNAIALYTKQKRLVGLVEEQIYEKQNEQSLMINILSHIVEFRSGEGGLHNLHVYILTEILLQNLMKVSDKYNLTPHEITLIATASSLHDIGKIAIDGKIVNKSEKLTPEELEILKKHTVYGADMLNKVPFQKNQPLLRKAIEICRWHHERYDGTGYPDGLKGDEIPISAQVVGLADLYEYLTDDRGYRQGVPHNQAVDMILNGKCGAFNPILLKAFKWASDSILSELRVSSLNGNNRKEIERVMREVISLSDMSVSQRTWNLLDRERQKNNFITSNSKEIFFEVYNNPALISFTEDSAKKLGVEMMVSDPVNNEKFVAFFGKDNLIKLFGLIDSAKRDNPIVSMDCDIVINDNVTRCKVILLTQFLYNATTGTDDFESATGKIEILD